MSIAESPYLTLLLGQKVGEIYPALFADKYFTERDAYLKDIPVELLFDKFMGLIKGAS